VAREWANDPLPEDKKMDSEQISQTVDRWVAEDVRHGPGLAVIRKNSPWYGISDEEIEDRKEFIRCYLNTDFAPLLLIPVEPRENDFWFASHQDFMESAFNTWDFQRDRKPFDKYGYRIKKVLEQVKDLAVLHSSISYAEGRANTQRRYESLVDSEFRGRLLGLMRRYQRALGEEEKIFIRKKIEEMNRRIFQCEKIWQEYAFWE
jgi:hypothetical protein